MLTNSVFYRDVYMLEAWDQSAKETRERSETEELFGRMLCTILDGRGSKRYED